jgi:hypothetical protein
LVRGVFVNDAHLGEMTMEELDGKLVGRRWKREMEEETYVDVLAVRTRTRVLGTRTHWQSIGKWQLSAL